jgi:hypothetical protein
MGILFDSKYEVRIYQKLLNLFSSSQIRRQIPLLVKPPSSVYPPLYWKVDFGIETGPEWPLPEIYIEAKGFVTTEFKRQLNYLNYFSPKIWERLLIVSERKQIIDKQVRQCSAKNLGSTLWNWQKTLNLHFDYYNSNEDME